MRNDELEQRYPFGSKITGTVGDYAGSVFQTDQSFYFYKLALGDDQVLNIVADDLLSENKRISAQSCGAFQCRRLSEEFHSVLLSKIEYLPEKTPVLTKLKTAIGRILG